MRKVRIKLMALDAAMHAKDGTLRIVRDIHDVGIGLVVGTKSDPLDDDTDRVIYHIAVVEGRFDGHRNDAGELWVNESEIMDLEAD